MNSMQIISRRGTDSVTIGQCDCNCDCACMDQLTRYTVTTSQFDCDCDCACIDELAYPLVVASQVVAGQCDCACLDELVHPAVVARQAFADQCDCDCDCACLDEVPCPPVPQAVVTSDVTWRHPSIIYIAPLALPPSLGLADEQYTLMFNPRTGQLPAVLNLAAVQLWERFATPARLATALKGGGVAYGEASRALSHLAALRLIEPEADTGAKVCGNVPATLAAWLHVTNACNLRCAYCYLDKTHEAMSAETGRLAIESIFRSAVANQFHAVKLKYAGGEPTLNFGRVLEMHRYAQSLATEFGLILDGVVLSNGVALSDRVLEAMRVQNLRLMISLDGVGPAHDAQRTFPNGQGSFAWVERGIERALVHGIVPDISIVISDRNADGLPELIAWVLERDLPFGLNFYRENDCSASAEDLQLSDQRIIAAMRAAYEVISSNLPRRSLLASLLDRANLAAPHHHTCGVGRNYLAIDHRGQISKCQMDMAHSVTDVHASDPLQEVRADKDGLQNVSVEEKEGCCECAWQHWCTGSCPLYTYRVTGRYDVKSPNCEIYKALFPDVLWLEGLRLLKYGA